MALQPHRLGRKLTIFKYCGLGLGAHSSKRKGIGVGLGASSLALPLHTDGPVDLEPEAQQ
jgi:hypothetical protein